VEIISAADLFLNPERFCRQIENKIIKTYFLSFKNGKRPPIVIGNSV